MINPGSPIADSDYGEGLIHKMTTIRNTFSSEALSGRLRLSLLALAAALTVGLVLMLPGGLLHAQEANTIDYAENGTAPVATFSSTDADDDTIMWRISGTDSGVFKIDAETGELEFLTSPTSRPLRTSARTTPTTRTRSP